MFFKLLLFSFLHFLIVNGRMYENSKNTLRRLKRDVVFKDEILEFSWTNINFEKECQNDPLMLISVMMDKSLGYIFSSSFPYLTDKEPNLDCEAARNHEDFILSPSTAAFKIDTKALNLLPFRTDTSPSIHLYPNRSRIKTDEETNQTVGQMIKMISYELDGTTYYNISFAMFIDSDLDEGLCKIYFHFCDNVKIDSGIPDERCTIGGTNNLDTILIVSFCVQLIGYVALILFAWYIKNKCDGHYSHRVRAIDLNDDDFKLNLVTTISRFELYASGRFVYLLIRLFIVVIILQSSLNGAGCEYLNNYREKAYAGVMYTYLWFLLILTHYSYVIPVAKTIPGIVHIIPFVTAIWCLNELLHNKLYLTNVWRLTFTFLFWPIYLGDYPIENNPSSRIMEDLQTSSRLMNYTVIIYVCIPSFNIILAAMVLLGLPYQLYWIQYAIEDILFFFLALALTFLHYHQFLIVKRAFDRANEANNNNNLIE